MKREVNIFTAAALLSVLMLMLSGSTDGIISDIIHGAAFLIPAFAGLALERRMSAAEERHASLYIKPEGEGFILTLPCIAPAVALVLGLSALTALVITSVTGRVDEVSVGDSFTVALFLHVLLPAIFEEALFRYLSLRLFGERAPRLALMLSATYFALAHSSLFRIPYAFAAGIILTGLDLLCGSVLPSVILHFINNLCSLLLVFFSESEGFTVGFFVTLGVLTAASVVVILLWRRRYATALSKALKVRERWQATNVPLLYIIPTAFIAITALL